MSLSQAKKFFLATIILILTGANLFALSIPYKRPEQPFDSHMRVRALGNVGQDQDTWNFGYFGVVKKTELPKIYVEISGPGKQIYQHYGHAGIVLEFESIGPITFDYGVFNMAEPRFVINFIHGNLYYYLWCHRNYQDDELRNEQRSNKYYRLDLSDDKKIQLIDFLVYNAQDENKYYLYDFFKDNCSTRIRDILDKLYDGKLSEKYSKVPCGTYRQAIERAIRPYNKAIEFSYNVLYGSSQDKKISFYDALFLPEYLEIAMVETGIGTLERQEDYPVIYKKSVKKGVYLGPNYIFYLLVALPIFLALFLLGFFGKKKKFLLRFQGLIAFLIEIVFGVLSIVSLYAQSFTIHRFLWFNYNIIFINPLMVVCAIYSLLYFIHPVKYEKQFVDWHKIVSSLIVVALLGKIFYRQVNLYLIIYFILHCHFIISSYSWQNIENVKTFRAFAKKVKKIWKR